MASGTGAVCGHSNSRTVGMLLKQQTRAVTTTTTVGVKIKMTKTGVTRGLTGNQDMNRMRPSTATLTVVCMEAISYTIYYFRRSTAPHLNIVPGTADQRGAGLAPTAVSDDKSDRRSGQLQWSGEMFLHP